MTSCAARLDGVDGLLTIGTEGVDFDGELIPWHAIDTLADDGPRMLLGVVGDDGTVHELVLSHLGASRDTQALQMREMRGHARRRALAQSDLPATDHFMGRQADAVVDVWVLPHGLVVEPRGTVTTYLPWGLVKDVQREGYRLDFVRRWGGITSVSHLGAATDDFVAGVERAESELSRAAGAAARERGAPDLAWVDGWAVRDDSAVRAWVALDADGYATTLAQVCTELRAGIYTEGGSLGLAFLLGVSGSSVVVEGVGERDRATFVFATADIERVNAALLTCSFRREPLYLPEVELGPLAAAVRTQPEVSWLRSVFKARVVHDGGWQERLRAEVARGEGKP